LITETSTGTNIPYTAASVPADGKITLTTTDPGTISFTNTGSKGSIVVDKSVANGLTDGVFTFTISKVGVTGWSYSGTPVVITYPGNTGNKTFTDLDLNATYLITETSTGTNIPYTAASVPADGKITLTTTDPGTISFTNTGSKGSIHITKALLGGLTGGIYTFSIKANDAGATWTHPNVTINLDDSSLLNDSVLITDVPLGSYTVTEIIPGGATYHVVIPSGGTYTANLTAISPNATAAFTNEPNTYSVSVQKVTVGTGFTGSFTFDLQLIGLDTSGATTYTSVSALTISTAGGTASFPGPITAGTYRVVETGRGGATYTDVSNSGIPAVTAVSNMTSPTFVLNEGNTSQTVYFVNSIPGTPPNGSIMIVKNVTVTQGANTTFTFTITPAVNGVSSYNVVVPANQATGTFTINGVPFNTTYSISENSLPGWFLQSSEGLTFTLNAAASLATPVFTNTPTGGGTTTTAGITVAGISTGPEGGIQVLGIQEMPFTGSRDTLFKFGIAFIVFGLMMMLLLPIYLRSGKHLMVR
ncbi:MAG: autotransporter outer membrane beta-barrel domain-containing protein, partial [Candidatus Humimicrobiaceae bacterium]